MDIGTGDGKYVLAAAAAHPDTFFVGLDADASRMREASRRGAPALFVVAAAEAPPGELAGRAALVTVHFPWGSLLRGVLGIDADVLAGIAAIAAPGATIRALVSVTDRDRAAPAEALREAAALARRYASCGLTLECVRPASAEEIRSSRSTWAKRLSVGSTSRPSWLVHAVKERDGRVCGGDQRSWPGGGGWQVGQ